VPSMKKKTMVALFVLRPDGECSRSYPYQSSRSQHAGCAFEDRCDPDLGRDQRFPRSFSKRPVQNFQLDDEFQLTQSMLSLSCLIVQFIGNWGSSGTNMSYPLQLAEGQGGMLGTDLFIAGGFVSGFKNCTPACYARNVNVPGAPWRRMDDIPISAGITHGAVAIVGMKFYMCGGYVFGICFVLHWIDLPTHRVSPHVRSFFSFRFVGGHPGPDTAGCFVYNHANIPGGGEPQWTSLPSLPSGRAGGSLVYITAQNALLYTGGAKRTGAQYYDYQDSWLLPLDLNGGSSAAWIAKPNLPYFGNHMSFVSAKDHLGVERYFFMGGQRAGNESNGNQDDHYEYDAVNEVWIERQKMPTPRGHAGSTTLAVSCGFIIAGGAINSGSNSSKAQTKDVSYYDISSNTWTQIGNLSQSVRTICGIDFVNSYLYCETGVATSRYSSRIRIEAPTPALAPVPDFSHAVTGGPYTVSVIVIV
jgi:hypothetical protein